MVAVEAALVEAVVVSVVVIAVASEAVVVREVAEVRRIALSRDLVVFCILRLTVRKRWWPWCSPWRSPRWCSRYELLLLSTLMNGN